MPVGAPSGAEPDTVSVKVTEVPGVTVAPLAELVTTLAGRSLGRVGPGEVARGQVLGEHGLELALGHPALDVDAVALVLKAVAVGVLHEGHLVAAGRPGRQPAGRAVEGCGVQALPLQPA